MEVYMIKNKINGKIYIGSTIGTKELRFGLYNLKDTWSSSHIACMNRMDNKPLYSDMNKYGYTNFELSTLQEYSGPVYGLRCLEDKMIKEYWDKYGSCMMYNQVRGAFGDASLMNTKEIQAIAHEKSLATRLDKYDGDCMAPCHSKEVRRRIMETCRKLYGGTTAHMLTPEAIAKAKVTRAKTMTKKYGSVNGAMTTEESMAKSIATRIRKYGTANGPVLTPEVRAKATAARSKTMTEKYGSITAHLTTPEIRKKASDKITNTYLYKGEKYRGIREVHAKMQEEGYPLSYTVVKQLVSNRYFSKKNTKDYPELINAVQVIEKRHV